MSRDDPTRFNPQLWLGAVLRLLDKRPAGDKPRVGELARQLQLTQPDVIATVEALITAHRLNPQTLRSPIPVKVLPIGASSQRRPYCRQPDDCVAGAKGRCRVCHAKPRAKAAPAALQPADPFATGGQLADRLAEVCKRLALSKSRVGQQLFGMKGGIEALRRRRVTPGTVAKVEAFLAAPGPLDDLQHRRPTLPVKPAAPVAKRGRLSAEQHSAAVRRGIGQQATRILDGDTSALTEGGAVSPAVRGAMKAIQDRRDYEARQADPVEQAKLALRRRGRVVCDANVLGGPKNRFMVSGQRDPDTGKARHLTGDELIALARAVNPTFYAGNNGSAQR